MSRFLIISLIFSYTQLLAQKHDANWFFGYGGWSSNPNFESIRMDFNGIVPEIQIEKWIFDFHRTNASISDEDGNLLFYSNGISIANANHEIMENGETIIDGEAAVLWDTIGYRMGQGAIILPFPNYENKYFLFHEKVERLTINNVPLWIPTEVISASVDMSKNNGLGKVTNHGNVHLQGKFDRGNLTAVKHGNGKDWWLIIGGWDSNQYFKLLITENGVRDAGIQAIGRTTVGGLGQALFTPDGSKYIKNSLHLIDEQGYIDIYDFDRCTGELSNHISFRYKEPGVRSITGGLSISPNSQYLYVIDQETIYQYDLYAANIKNSEIVVAKYDGFGDPFPTYFYYAQLAPDGKIYIQASNSTNYLHVISMPNMQGILCDVKQHHINLGVRNITMPNFPNYRLGTDVGSLCDTLSSISASLISEQHISLSPNPTSDIVNINFEVPLRFDGHFTLFDLTGKRTRTFHILPNQSRIQFRLNHLPSGLYFYKIKSQKTVLKTGKIIVAN